MNQFYFNLLYNLKYNIFFYFVLKLSSNSNDVEKLEHLICFTLSNTFYMETLNQKLFSLYKIFPLIEGKHDNLIIILIVNSNSVIN